MTTSAPIVPLAVRRLLVAAGQAPSVLNTQPWRFRVRENGQVVDLLADGDRWLPVSDPRGRSLHVSCGAALYNLRIAARAAGRRAAVRLLPDSPRESEVLARIDLSAREPATREARRLYELISRRRTNRAPYDPRPVPPRVLADLRAVASAERARFLYLDRPSADDLLNYTAIAQEQLVTEHDYLDELTSWTNGQGLPAYVAGPRAIGGVDPVRDFGHRGGGARFEPQPQLAVLTTAGDEPLDWLRAGQALQHVLLVAAGYGISASFLNQPLDLRDMRRHTDPRHRRGHPQMIMRLGFGPPVPRTPRRPATELLA